MDCCCCWPSGNICLFFDLWVLIHFLHIYCLDLLNCLLLLSKNKPKLAVESVEEDNIHESVEQSSPQMEDTSASRQQPETEINKESGSYDNQIHDYIVKSPDVFSENECFDYQLSTTEDSEVEWPFRSNMDRTPDWSDEGSISDEDSLIEISLPGGHYVKHKEDEPNNYNTMHQKFPEPIFQQRSLMELLAELNDMNEEENLIEIDISMGSIKCSRFEIEA
ncbi:uncharacterized protein LOC120146406 [Hibiscus syriacus]|uniref:uncharacterized protein LOC120146406 n=1 Tax=Hibiscus syriacus TaxID=106335 RepID=UPI001921D1AA|nr:uncharacterized protein LOC120146406 [Hibiscus syriacus]